MKPSPYARPGQHPRPGQTAGGRPALQRQPTAEERRRAQRVLLRMPVVAHIKDKQPVSGTTHTVSASGAMIILPQGLEAGTKFVLENPRTQQKVEVNVVRPSQLNQEGSLVPVEFVTPAPNFWNIFFPPNVN